MESFVYRNPTVLHFGRHSLDGLPDTLQNYGKKVLLVYGKGSVKKTGLYDKIKDYLAETGAAVVEYEGIRPNPVIEDVDAAAALGRQHNVDLILAVGGGSVIDSAKLISIAIPVSHPLWDFLIRKEKPAKAVPLIGVLTLAATGTEMNPFAVISNPKEKFKDGYGSPLMYPAHSFLDPQLTVTVPADYTAYGIADLIAHCMEAFFGAGESTLGDRFILSIIKEAMQYGPKLLNDLSSYDLREKIMYAATMALNGMTTQGKKNGDWAVHGIGHVLSLLYDVPHGASLSIVYPAWMKRIEERYPDRIAELGTGLFDKSLTAHESIWRIEEMFRSIQCPVRLSETSVKGADRQKILELLTYNKVSGANYKLEKEDLSKIVELFM
jgi:alcohol dehydrogenase YqhD (iron-dependent ADH family)